MSSQLPDAPEAVALALMRDIEAAEEKAGRRERGSNRSERERLLASTAIAWAWSPEPSGPRPCTDPAAPLQPRRRDPAGFFSGLSAVSIAGWI